MKKIINGKKYDTTTAKEIADKIYFGNGNYACAWDTLYLKKTGEFFIEHQTNGSDLFDREEYIKPVDEVSAKKFCEEYLDADEYEKLFGEVEE